MLKYFMPAAKRKFHNHDEIHCSDCKHFDMVSKVGRCWAFYNAVTGEPMTSVDARALQGPCGTDASAFVWGGYSSIVPSTIETRSCVTCTHHLLDPSQNFIDLWNPHMGGKFDTHSCQKFGTACHAARSEDGACRPDGRAWEPLNVDDFIAPPDAAA
jgi:hypothetical protein